MLALTCIAFLLIGLDILVGTVDVLPDVFGFAIMMIPYGYFLFRHKVRPFVILFPACGFIFSILMLIFTSSVWCYIFPLLENVALFFTMLVVFQLLWPDRPKNSQNRVTYQSTVTATFFLAFTTFFGGFFSIFDWLTYVILLLQVIMLVYICFTLCPPWQSRIIDE